MGLKAGEVRLLSIHTCGRTDTSGRVEYTHAHAQAYMRTYASLLMPRVAGGAHRHTLDTTIRTHALPVQNPPEGGEAHEASFIH